MINELRKLVEEHAGETIIQNKSIPDSQNEDAVQAVTSGIMEGFKETASKGNYYDLVSMLQQSTASGFSSITGNSTAANIFQQVVGSLSSKLGISPEIAQQVASKLIPQVMNHLASKTSDPNDHEFDLQDMLRNFSGQGDLDLQDIMGKIGGVKGKEGGFGDIVGKILGR